MPINLHSTSKTSTSFTGSENLGFVRKFSKFQTQQLQSTLNCDPLWHRKVLTIHNNRNLFSRNNIFYSFNSTIRTSNVTNATIDARSFKTLYARLTNAWATKMFSAETAVSAFFRISATIIEKCHLKSLIHSAQRILLVFLFLVCLEFRRIFLGLGV